MHRALFVLGCAATLSGRLVAADPALDGHDPVSLCLGKQQAGDPNLTATAGRFTYRFATEESRKKFLAAPEQYGIQFGGACMKMGPLSGYGSPSRWDVHDGRIYLFASEGCRNAFRADPKKFIDQPDAEPQGTDAQLKRGAELMARAVQAVGGESRIKELKTFQVRTKLTQPPRDGKTFTYYRTFSASLPEWTAAEWESYDNARYGWVSSPGDSFRTSAKNWEKVDDQVRQFMARDVARKPLWLLAAWTAGKAKAVALEPVKEGERTIERVAVSMNGATTTLGIDPQDGAILSVSHRGRASAGIADIERRFSDFKVVKGVSVPFRVETSINGKRVEGGTKAEIEAVLIDEPIPAGTFRQL